MRSAVSALLGALLGGLVLSACQRDERMENILRLQRQILEQKEMLGQEAATADPTRKDLKATYEDSSIMQYRPTSNPDRPIVAHVQIKWRFDHLDGRPGGEAVFDYVFALDRRGHWIKADEPEDEKPPSPIDRASPLASPVSPKPA